MSNAIIYSRVSGKQQAESGLGMEAQIDTATRYAAANALAVVGIYRDDAVKSTIPIDQRPGLMAAINALTKGSILIVAKRDRIGRDPILVAMIEAAAQRKGAKIVSAGGEANGDSITDTLMKRIVDAFSEYERLMIGARTKAALRAKKTRGERTGTVPIGYNLGADGQRLVINAQEQAIIEQINTLRNQGYTLRAIADELTRQGITTKNGQVKWSHATVAKIVNRAA